MTISLYSAVVPGFQQLLPQVQRLIDKAEAHCTERGLAPGAVIDARIAPDMLPFGYQVKSAAVHSLGAIEGVRRGSFSPDRAPWPEDFAGLRARIEDTLAALKAIEPAEIDGFVGQDMCFLFGERRMDFTAEDFLLSFSLPNFYFHVTTAYAILRGLGLPIGKTDYVGRARFKA